jgi:phage gp46-like protein
MTDLTLLPADHQISSLDLALTAAGDLQTGQQLHTAVAISLFTDRLAAADDPLPDGTDRRGWWADAWEPDLIGSRLWLLSREKQLNEVVLRAQQYAEEALNWLIEDGIASRIQVQAWIVRFGMLGLQVDIVRPHLHSETFRFNYVWSEV